MSLPRRLRRAAVVLARFLVFGTAILLGLVLAGIAVLQTGWAKDHIRQLIVRQANRYLTATLEIGRLEGSLLRGIELGDIRLVRDGVAIIRIDEVAVSYSIRDLIDKGVVIKRLRVVSPHVVADREADGHWNLAGLVKRETREEGHTGPSRPIEIQSIEVDDADLLFKSPLQIGAVHLPSHFAALNARFSFAYAPVRWRLTFADASWRGSKPDLSVDRLSGTIEDASSVLSFSKLDVRTARSGFELDGRIDRRRSPAALDLGVRADRFAFQEWSGVLSGLKNIAVDGSFDANLNGPVNAMTTALKLQSTGGSVAGTLVLDTTVPGWRGRGVLDVGRLNLARWLNQPAHPSDITGRVSFDLALELGHHFPRGTYTFAGPHVSFMDYAADDLRARGEVTATSALVAEATARAYGAAVAAGASSIGLDTPFPFRFQGTIATLDLRALPKTIPVPHVESKLAFGYDVTGRFVQPFIVGRAEFADSQFLGADIANGTIGTIDTSKKPVKYGGDGTIDHVDLGRFGRGLDVAWLQEPRYEGTLSGRFHVTASGADPGSLSLSGGGRVTSADIFGGALSNAAVTIDIGNGSLRASYDGVIDDIDPAIAFGDERFAASLNGTASVKVAVRDLLTEPVDWDAYDVEGTLTLERSVLRGIAVDHGCMEAALRDSMLTVRQLDLEGAAIGGRGSGTIAVTAGQASRFDYEIDHADLSKFPEAGMEAGTLSSKGRVSGPYDRLRLAGDGTVDELQARGASALSLAGKYDVTWISTLADSKAQFSGQAAFMRIFNESIDQASGTLSLNDGRVSVDLKIQQTPERVGSVAGNALVDPEQREVRLRALTLSLGSSPWHLVTPNGPPTVQWSETGFVVDTPLVLAAGATNDQRIAMSGSWNRDGGGALRVTASRVFLETLRGDSERPARYGGVVDLDATLGGTGEAPTVRGTFSVTNGRVRRLSYERLSGQVAYDNEMFTVDLRLDQAPGLWLTASGTVPLSLYKRSMPERPIDLAVQSSSIDLGLLEGVTDLVHSVHGQARFDLKVLGTSTDPHFSGSIKLQGTTFQVTSTGARYKNGAANITLAPDRITVDAFHVEDNDGDPLDLSGSLGTHELQLGSVQVDAKARNFDVVRNELGRVSVDASLQLRGKVEQPMVAGDIAIRSGEVKVDEIMERLLFQPYATTAAEAPAESDPMAALNPWQRLALDISLHVPETLRLTGQDVQVSPGTPIGLGRINLRVGGDLAILKDATAPLAVYGSFDAMSGLFAFQGRQFDIQPGSSINFRGDLSPEVYVIVARDISGVQARVTISGDLHNPELRLASTPPLDQSDILALIVFNTSLNQLSTSQQQELAVRAGTLAAGFLAAPLVSALERGLGLETLQIEPSGDFSTGPKVTIGEEIAPGLVARFSRQFGTDEYNQAIVQYYLSRIFQIRATFSDAASVNLRLPFRRVERAGIDLLMFFSF